MEKFHGFLQGKAKVDRADFGLLVIGAQAGERQRGIGAGGNGEVHTWRQQFEQRPHELLDPHPAQDGNRPGQR